MINGFLPAPHANHHRASLQESKIYKVAHFEVVKCPYMYKTTEHPYVIRFIDQTTLDPVMDDEPVIQLQKFMVRSYDHLHILANTNLELPDVVGEIKSVKGFGISNTEIISPVIIRLLIAPTIEVDVALLDDAAAVFKGLLNSRDSTHSVMLITSLNPQKIGDSFYLVSTDATRFYSGPNLPAITEFTTSLRGEHDKELPILDAETVVTYNQLSSIGDLNMFLSNTTSQGAFFSCKAQIVEIVSQNGWYYVSCTRCGETLKYSAASLHCNQCHDTNAIGVVRYQVEILVDDGSNYATFLVLDKDMFKLTKKMQQLCLLMSGNGNNLPPSLAQLRGRDFVFHVRVTPDKFTTNTRPFTVCGISDILNNENFIINANKSVEVEYEEASAGAIALTTTPTSVKEGGPDISSD
ncbi:hypothetical protein Bca4012_016895 [Brassica carinata]